MKFCFIMMYNKFRQKNKKKFKKSIDFKSGVCYYKEVPSNRRKKVYKNSKNELVKIIYTYEKN